MAIAAPKRSLRKIRRIPHPRESRKGFELMDRNERSVDFPPQAIEEIRGLITPFLLRAYPEPEAFYEKLSRWLGLSREMLLVSWGADGALRTVFETFVEPQEEVVHVVPSYAMVPVYCDLAGALSRAVSFKEDLSLSLEQILEAITPATKLVVLANPNQPIERMYEEAECRKLLERCRRQGALLVMDEAYHHFCRATAVGFLQEYENLVVVRSFSKAFGAAGLRLGYLVSSRQNIEEMNKVRPMYETHSLAIAVGLYLLEHEDLMKQYVQEVARSRAFLKEAFGRMGWKNFGQVTNSLLVALPDRLAAKEVAAFLKKQRFLVRAEMEPPLSNHLRVTLGSLEQAHRFWKALEERVEEPVER